MIDVRGINVHAEVALRGFFEAHGIAAAYLFGSRASGGAHSHSDYDLGVLFRGYHPERHNFALRLTLTEELALVLGGPVDLSRSSRRAKWCSAFPFWIEANARARQWCR